MKMAIENHKFSHGKVMKFRFQDFVGTLSKGFRSGEFEGHKSFSQNRTSDTLSRLSLLCHTGWVVILLDDTGPSGSLVLHPINDLILQDVAIDSGIKFCVLDKEAI